jgi:thiamine transport system substrate-binding protein
MSRRTRLGIITAALVPPLLVACSAGGGPSSDDDSGSTTVTLVTHDSWSMPKKVMAQFEQESGYELEVLRSGDAGQVTNKLVLTAENPIGDAVYGIDNTFASRAMEAGVLADHEPADLPDSASAYVLADDQSGSTLTPVDWSDVCVNVDLAWFEAEGIEPPSTLEDLVDPRYDGLFVTPGASTSSPGFAFLLATIGRFGEDGWLTYWEQLVDNGARVVSGWSDAYEVDFTASGGKGDRPIVVSYASSPPFTIPEGEQRPTTAALLDTCFRQVEYAGVLTGADNPQGAADLVDFMTSSTFQDALAESMYVFPVDDEAALPRLWKRWAEPSPSPIDVPAAEVVANRDEWLRAWSDVTAR